MAHSTYKTALIAVVDKIENARNAYKSDENIESFLSEINEIRIMASSALLGIELPSNTELSPQINVSADMWQYHPAVKNKEGRLGRVNLHDEGKVMVIYTNDGNWVFPMWEWLDETEVQLTNNYDVALFPKPS